MSNFEEIRDIMYQTPDEGLWNRLVRTLRAWTGEDPLDVTLTYCRDHMAAWPKDLPTFAPPGWLQRPLADIENDPLLDFLVFAARDRTDHFLTKARVEVDKGRVSKMPSWLNVDGLETMHWRSGEPFDDKQTRRLLSKMKSRFDTGVGNVDLQRLRHYLNDADCQRWGKQIHDDWIAAGSESSQKWGLFQVAVFGQTSQIPCDVTTYKQLLSRNRSARVRQYVNIIGNAQTEDSYRRLTQTMLSLPLRLKTRHALVSALNRAASHQDSPLLPFLKTRGGLWIRFDDEENELLILLDGEPSLDEELREMFLTLLENALVCQREWTFQRLRDTLLSTAVLSESLQPLVWHTDADHTFRWTDAGPINAKGEPVNVPDDAMVTLSHPARLSNALLDAWREQLAQAGLAPIFEQLERPFWRTDKPVMTDPVPVYDAFFFHDLPHWQYGEEHARGYTKTLIHNLRLPLWTIEVSLNYGLSTFESHSESWSDDPDAIESFVLRDKLGGAVDWSKDPVAYSEASAIVAKLLTAAKAKQTDEQS